eukprot:TRINITY_DN76840_c0_g1_i1.p1 TRINITY_DN76840_c0_g1~~TRINITY_DN76840_c0_g1_i1.p1  ORF type:complete len:212 (-),score=17.79 TRINITY_DN76840_c0_g1_i1:227-820(-)
MALVSSALGWVGHAHEDALRASASDRRLSALLSADGRLSAQLCVPVSCLIVTLLAIGFMTPTDFMLNGASLVRFLDHVRESYSRQQAWINAVDRLLARELPEMLRYRIVLYLIGPASEDDSAAFGSRAGPQREVWGRIYTPAWLASYRFMRVDDNWSVTDGTETLISTPRTAPETTPRHEIDELSELLDQMGEHQRA